MILRRPAIVLPCLAIVMVLSCVMAHSDDNGSAPDQLLVNADLTSGDSVFPNGWKSWGFDCLARFQWIRDAKVPAEMAVTTLSGTEAGIQQPVKLRPGWYHLSVE